MFKQYLLFKRKLKGKIKRLIINFKTSQTQTESDFILVPHEGLFEEYLEMGLNRITVKTKA